MFLQKPMLGTQLDWSNPLNDGVVLDLLMNEGHGDVVHDLSGYGNHGALNNFAFPPTQTSGWNPGADGDALTFDGVDDYVDFGHGASLDITKAITMDMIVKSISNSDTNRGIFGKRDNDNHRFFYGFRTGWSTSVYPTIRVDSVYIYAPSYHCPIGQLTRLTMTFDCKTLNFFVNGVFYSKYDIVGNIDSAPDNSVYMQYPSGDNWNGAIARARILTRAMSAFEVMQTQINPYGVYLQ